MDNTRQSPYYVDETPPVNWQTIPEYKWPNAELETRISIEAKGLIAETIELLKQMEDACGRAKESICNVALRSSEVNYNFDNDTARKQLVKTTNIVNECGAAFREAEHLLDWALYRIFVIRKRLCKHVNNVVKNKGTTFWWGYQCLDCGKTTSNMEELRPKILSVWSLNNE